MSKHRSVSSSKRTDCTAILFILVVGLIFWIRPTIQSIGLFVDNYDPRQTAEYAVYVPPAPKQDDLAAIKPIRKPTAIVSITEQRCLAKTLYWEVRKNNPEEMRLVADVLLTRMKDQRYPNTFCENIHQKHQFQWVSLGLNDERKLQTTVTKNSIEQSAWQTANDIAHSVLDGRYTPKYKNLIAYHANTMAKPRSYFWNRLHVAVKSDLHTFYKPI